MDGEERVWKIGFAPEILQLILLQPFLRHRLVFGNGQAAEVSLELEERRGRANVLRGGSIA